MGRSMWTGNISFGMVTIPVKLHTATEGYGLAFHQLHKECDTRIQEHRYCPHCDEEVEWEDIVKGYEYKPGEYVEITKDDLEQLPLPSKHTIDVADFVKLSEIDPIYYDSVYYIEVEKGSEKAFRLLFNALDSKNLAGIATIAFRSKERMCALRPMNKTLVLHTLLYEDQIKEDDGKIGGKSEPSAGEKKMADMLVSAMMTKFDPSKFKDHYDVALKQLVQSKLKGTKLKVVKEDKATGVTDLMEALRRSLAGGKGGARKAAASASKLAGGKTRQAAKTAAKKSATKAKSKATSKPKTVAARAGKKAPRKRAKAA